MKCKLITEKVDGVEFIGGYCACEDAGAIELPEELQGIVQWRDEFDNYLFALIDEKAVPVTIKPTASQIAAKASSVDVVSLLTESVQGNANDSDAWAAFCKALRGRN